MHGAVVHVPIKASIPTESNCRLTAYVWLAFLCSRRERLCVRRRRMLCKIWMRVRGWLLLRACSPGTRTRSLHTCGELRKLLGISFARVAQLTPQPVVKVSRTA